MRDTSHRAFWKNFKKSSKWKKPTLFKKGAHPGSPLSAEEIFEVVVVACKSSEQGLARIRFYGDGNNIINYFEYLPRHEDRNFEGWSRRIETHFTNYALVFNQLENHFGAKIKGIRDYLSAIADAVGYPTKATDLTLFAGRYDKTPFGVHFDSEMNFYWPVIGPKKMRFWHPSTTPLWENLSREQRMDYQKHLRKSFVIDAKPGELLAWPGNWWHIGEASVFNVSFSSPLYYYTDSMMNYQKNLDRILEDLIEVSAIISNKTLVPQAPHPDGSVKIPDFIRDAATLLDELYPRDKLQEALGKKWMRSISTAGLRYPGEPLSKSTPEPSRGGVYQVPVMVRWARLGGRKICVVCDGNAIVMPESLLVLTVLKALNTLRPFSYNDLRKLLASKRILPSSKPGLDEVLGQLLRLGAVEVKGTSIQAAA